MTGDPAKGNRSLPNNLLIGFGLQKEGDNLNVRAVALHVFGDVGASVGIVYAELHITVNEELSTSDLRVTRGHEVKP